MFRQTLAILGMFMSAWGLGQQPDTRRLLMTQYTIRLEIKSLPQNTHDGAKIYVAGSFNGWNAKDSEYRFSRDEKGNYFIIMTLAQGTYEYKITRGGWERTECKTDGTSSENRILKVHDHETVELVIEEWADHFPAKPTKKSTAGENVRIVDTAFFMPQLGRKRRVWIYLPKEYKSGTASYPVLYMQDGQNIFDDATAFAGEWKVDEYLDNIQTGKIIVVAIDNGDKKRMTEYNPYDNEKFGKGEGKKYADFLVKTLKPFIDKNYRTLNDKSNTFIAGSSMGGLISFYCLLKYPAIFGGAGIFSPSFWIAPSIYKDIQKKGSAVNTNIYFYCGKNEGDTMLEDMLKAIETLKSVSKSNIKSDIRPEGKHNEASWLKEFPLFHQWLFEIR